MRVFMMVAAAVTAALLCAGCGPSIESSKRLVGDMKSWPNAYVDDLTDKGTKGVLHVVNASKAETYTGPVSIEAKDGGDEIVIKAVDGQYYLDMRKPQPGPIYQCGNSCAIARPFPLPLFWQLTDD